MLIIGASGLLLILLAALLEFSSLSLADEGRIPGVVERLPGVSPVSFSLFKRATSSTCDENTPCADGSCCNKDSGFCGRDAVHCNTTSCVSNCNAKSECGSWAEVEGTTCPLNVCCGYYGYCGVTDDFCITTGDTPCQSNCEQPSSTGLNTGNVTNLVIGYYEGWAPYRRGACPSRKPSWIRTDSITHLYVAFAYITPDTYEIYPMEGTSEDIFMELTNLKKSAPGLKVYASLGGWTFSDNGTDTQAVWGDLASTSAKRQKFISNLVTFMTNFGFDGVDLDWEYPGAGDRGGKERDVDNYVSLLRDIRTWWTAQSSGWGLSLTLPTSYWYMRWFDVEHLAEHVDWINLMTYDLHGSWDSPEDQIGSYVYAHTNLTEIEAALDLLWRNNVPASKVNLGLGFYGRSYTLEDPSCSDPGCPFSDGGIAGSCSGTSGILTYDEINAVYETYNMEPVYDKTAKVMYFAWDQDQWVSYDNVQTIRDKVSFANEQGLLGLFIWAIDQDTDDAQLLDAVLHDRGGLGSFKQQNGVGLSNSTNWTSASGLCVLSDCDTNPSCAGDYKSVGSRIECDSDGGDSLTRWVCCPRDNAPLPSTCTWRSSIAAEMDGTSADCTEGCNTDETMIAESPWFYSDEYKDQRCLSGYAKYCCKTEEDVQSACAKLDNECISIGDDGKPDKGDICAGMGKTFLTYAQDSCPSGTWRPWCCNAEYDGSSCAWHGPELTEDEDVCKNAQYCPQGTVSLGVAKKGAGSDCRYLYHSYWVLDDPTQYRSYDRALCCSAGEQVVYSQTAPVPLAWLFPDYSEDDDSDFTYDLELDQDANSEEDPNDTGFGWVIMAGPKDQLTSLNKRDGSHWELFDCPDRDSITEDHRITVRAICTDDSSDSNCDDLFLGGVENTVVEMPGHCGIGRYAMAVSMESATDQRLPGSLHPKLVKRGVNLQRAPNVYNFTFDYNFAVLQGRESNQVQVRIDYSDEPKYWKAIVDNDPKISPADTLQRRAMEMEVEDKHGGSWKRYLDHTYRKQRRETPDHELHEFNKRWTSSDLDDWLGALESIDDFQFEKDVTIAERHIQETFPFWIFNEKMQCQIAGIPYEAYFAVWADLSVDIQTSVLVSLIGKLNDLSSWKQSGLLFRNKGSMQAGLHMEAQARLAFSTGSLEMFGMQNFGAALTIPGILTVGPNFRVLAELKGEISIHSEAHYNLELINWNYAQRYPNNNNDIASGLTDSTEKAAGGADLDDSKESDFSWDVSASGDLTLTVTPLVEVGITFNSKLNVDDATVGLHLRTYATLYGSTSVGSTTDANVCYGAVAGAELFAQVKAPTMFGINPNRRYSFYEKDVDLIAQKCYTLTDFSPSTCDDCGDS